MARVALIGADGFVGSSIVKALSAKADIDLAPVTRTTYNAARDDGPYDNTAMPSKRFWARQNPNLDFIETVEKTSRLTNDWDAAKIIQISSISARSQLNTVYGRHKAAAEKLVEHSDNLILRLGPMYGEELDKGVLIDIFNDNPVFVARKSHYCFAPIDWIASWIADNLDRSGVMDLGGNDAIMVGDVADAVGSTSEFQGDTDDQILGERLDGAPAAHEAIDFLHQLSKKKN
ncbi:NAD(P)-dependent oxidoreductase [Alphaproteobacteria bacterium]|nr:NAD(P)-dependent oxidoreductase [Alphaproteobacteria bacterium]